MILTDLFYSVINWKNRPSTATALGATNLNHMDKGILECAKNILQLSQDKAENSTVNGMVKDVSIDMDTWIVTVTKQDGTVSTYDLPIEQVVVNFTITDDNILVLTLEDGTQKLVDISRFVYSFDSSATIAMSMTDRHVTATVVDGSITMDMLEASIKSTFLQYKMDAETAEANALQYSRDSKRYAVGGVMEGDAEDNAEYYYQQAKIQADMAAEYAGVTAPNFYVDPESMALYMKAGVGVDFMVEDDNVLYWKLS